MLIKCFKSLVFWLILLPLLYTLSGFVLLPWWVRTHLPALIEEKAHLEIRIEEVQFNPFTFELDAKKIALLNEAHETAISLERLYVNYEPSFLLKKEFYIRSLIIEKPSLNLLVDANGSLNLLALFSKAFPPTPTQPNENDSMVMPFVIEHVDIQNGETLFTDLRQKEPFKMAFGPINYVINNLSFHRDDLSIHALSIMLDHEEKISLASSVSIEPMKFNGELTIQNLPLSALWKYIMPQTQAHLAKGMISVHLPFFIDLEKEQPLVSIEKAALSLDEIQFVDAEQKKVIDIPSLKLADIEFDSLESRFVIATILLSKPSIELTREKEHELNLLRLFNLSETKQSSESQHPLALKFLLKTITCEEGMIFFKDLKAGAFSTQLSSLNFTVTNITHDTNQTLLYELHTILDDKGDIDIKGQIIPSSLRMKAALNAHNLTIEKLQPYLEPLTTLTLKEGLLSLNLLMEGAFKENSFLKIDGNLSVEQLKVLDHFKKSIVAWEALNIDDIAFSTLPSSLHVKKITLTKPYVNLDIQKDKSTNFTDIIKQSTLQESKKETPNNNDEKSMEIFIGDIALKSGSANFKDASLPIPFATFIDQLNGNFSTLNTQNSKPSLLKLEGKVDKHGYAKIEGSILAFDFKDRANLKLLFKNIDMPSLTPYSGKFVGYAIKEGKLSMDLNYKVKKGLMEGENKINLDSLTLGDPIQSDEATNLPLGLAIAILKDSKGQIDLDLPVSGNLNDPDFRYGSIVWKAFGNLIGSIVTSPFKLLGSMLGIETETLKSIDFSAGEVALIASEEEKMEQYKQILDKRAELKLIITPSYNEALDSKFLKEAHVTAQIEALIPKKNKEEDSYSQAIKKLFIQKYSDEIYAKSLKSYKEQHLDVATINDNLIAKIAETVTISSKELTDLADNRANTIIEKLSTKYKITPKRLIKNEVASSDAIREQWIGCAISVSN